MKKIAIILSFLLAATVSAQPNVQEALEFSEAGWNYVFFGEYKQAEKMFEKSLKLNPNDKETKFGYAKSLVHNAKYKKAKEVLNKLEVDSSKEKKTKKKYLLAVIDFYQEDWESAQNKFNDVVASQDNNYEVASKSYLKAIKERKKKFTVGATFGLLYDTRIIDEDFLSGVDEDGGRLFLGTDINYHYKKTKYGDVSFRAAAAQYLSFDDDLSLADPLKIDLQSVLFAEKEIANQLYSVLVKPTLEFVWLDFDNSGDKDFLYLAPVVHFLLAEKTKDLRVDSFYGFVRWYMGMPDSLENTDSDLDGLNLKGGWRLTNFLNPAKNRLWQVDTYAEINAAAGDNIKFWRLGGNYMYVIPFKGMEVGALGEGRVSLYSGTQNSDGDDRLDLLLGATAFARKSLKKWLSLDKDWLHAELRTGFTLNSSNVDEREYERFIIAALMRGQWRF